MELQDSTASTGGQPRAQRKAYEPDHFAAAYWTVPMILAWIMYRASKAVRWAAGEGEDEVKALAALALDRPSRLDPQCRLREAEFWFENAFKSGNLLLRGCAFDPGDRFTLFGGSPMQTIEVDRLGNLKLTWYTRDATALGSRPGAWLMLPGSEAMIPGTIGYHTIRAKRSDVLSIWPAETVGAVIEFAPGRKASRVACGAGATDIAAVGEASMAPEPPSDHGRRKAKRSLQEVEAWYRDQYLPSCEKACRQPSRADDEKAAKAYFGVRGLRNQVRMCRRTHAPESWHEKGPKETKQAGRGILAK